MYTKAQVCVCCGEPFNERATYRSDIHVCAACYALVDHAHESPPVQKPVQETPLNKAAAKARRRAPGSIHHWDCPTWGHPARPNVFTCAVSRNRWI